MGTVTQVMLTCDVCGSAKDVQTRTFGLDGKAYEIDLCPKDDKSLRKVAAGYVPKARKATAKPGARHDGHRPRSRVATAANSDAGRAPDKEKPGRSQAEKPGQSQTEKPRRSQTPDKEKPGRSQAPDKEKPGRSQAPGKEQPRRSQAQKPGQSQTEKPRRSQAQKPGQSQAEKPGRSQAQKPRRSQAPDKEKPGRGQAPNKEKPRRSRVTGSGQQETKTGRSERQPATVAGAKATAPRSKEGANGGGSEPPQSEAASVQAAKAGARQDKGIYVYGILPADIEMAAEMHGVGQDPGVLRVVRCHDVAALISEVDLSARLESPGDRRTHREVLDATATEVPVLPMPFGAVMTSEDAVAEELLAAHHDEFAAALAELEGRAEFLVEGRYADEASAASREEDAQAVRKAMEGVCVDSVVREPAREPDTVAVAFLVAADKESEVERVIGDLAQEWEGRIDVQLLGPIAAYDFATTAKPEG